MRFLFIHLPHLNYVHWQQYNFLIICFLCESFLIPILLFLFILLRSVRLYFSYQVFSISQFLNIVNILKLK